MTSRTTQENAAQARVAPKPRTKDRPAGMAVARAVAKASAPSRSKPGGAQPTTQSRPVAARATRGPRRSAMGRGNEERIAELKVKLRDDEYMNGAILRIATVLSARLTLR
jgi:hypothetical protein